MYCWRVSALASLVEGALTGFTVDSSCKGQSLCCDTEKVSRECWVSGAQLNISQFLIDILNICTEPSGGSGGGQGSGGIGR